MYQDVGREERLEIIEAGMVSVNPPHSVHGQRIVPWEFDLAS